MNKDCFPKPVNIGPCKAVPVVFLSTEIDGVDDTINPPENGAYHNTIVTYTLTKHTYIYDSAGIPTRTNYEGVIDDALNIESTNPVENKAITQAIADATTALQTNINLEVMAREQDRDNLQININKEVERAEAAETELQESIATETTARESADTQLGQRIDDIINSPDVRYIVDTYADLEAIDKTTIGDQDYARVLQDETRENASTYYQFSKSSNEWTYVGQTGPYYTKEQSDETFATKEELEQHTYELPLATDDTLGGVKWNINGLLAGVGTTVTAAEETVNIRFRSVNANNEPLDEVQTWAIIPSVTPTTAGVMTIREKQKLDALPPITAIGDNLELTDAGVLNATGGGSAVNILNSYLSNPAADDVYDATYINSRINGYNAIIGTPSQNTPVSEYRNNVLIGGGTNINGNNIYSGVAIGLYSEIRYDNSVALGSRTVTGRAQEVSIGNSVSLNQSEHFTRYLANVTDGVLDQDAVTVHQLNEVVGDINTALQTLISGTGAN